MTNENYPTDEFGRPNGRDYHYRIPLNNDQAVRKAALALKGMLAYQDRFVIKWDEYSGDKLSYMGIRTNDSKGHLTGLAEYAHSPKWRDLGVMSDIDEYRQSPKGGTKVRGTFQVDPQTFNGVSRLSFSTTIEETPKELEQAYEQRGDTWQNVMSQVRWAKDDAMDNAHEQIAKQQRNCDHDHAVMDDHVIGAAGYCEDCGAELDENKELAH